MGSSEHAFILEDMNCKATTKSGSACKSPAAKGAEGFCIAHAPEEFRKARGFGGAQADSGRPRRPREIELVEEVAEEFRQELRRVFAEGLTATRAVVVGNGPTAHIVQVPDHPHRLRVAIEINDRLHGRPRQSLDMSAGVTVEQVDTAPISRPEHAKTVAEILAQAGRSIN